jgi:mannose-6-phosphate isomerase-like protein (cupin superfamily)
MEITKLDKMTRGWFIGDFEPSVFKTNNFEVGYLHHKQGEFWESHYHQFCDEYNLLVKGKMKINNKIINENEICFIPKGISSSPEFLEDCFIVCVKVPSIPNDKIFV